jgi:hypothetical protein
MNEFTRHIARYGLGLKNMAHVDGWRRSVARRRAIADLTPDQLRDIGHPQAALPTLNVKAGLITNLMSMR